MDYIVNGKEFRFVLNPIEKKETRDSYFSLAKKVFGLDFTPWYQAGFCGDGYIPYTLYDGDDAVAGVGVVISDFKWQGSIQKYVQISTVMTDPEYRNMNLNGWMLERVVKEWKGKCDCIYIYANDSVLDYYPKFGFEKASEYLYSMSISKQPGTYRKLDIRNPKDMELLIEKYSVCNNPFSALTMEDNLSMIMFHCVSYLHDNIYYVEKYDAVVIAEFENTTMFCYDIYTEAKCRMSDILGILATEATDKVNLGFTPKVDKHSEFLTDDFICEKSEEENTTIFVSDTNHVFCTHKVTLPFLSRA